MAALASPGCDAGTDTEIGGSGGAGGGTGGSGANSGSGSGGIDAGDVNVGDSPCATPTVATGELKISGLDASEALAIEVIDGRKGGWFSFPDSLALSHNTSGVSASAGFIRAQATAALDEDGGVGAQLNAVGNLSCAHNATAYSGVSFWVRSSQLTTTRFQVASGWTTPVAEGGTCLSDCYNHHWVQVSVGDTWQRVEVRWDELLKANWGQSLPFDARQITQLIWGVPKSEAFELDIDNVEFLSGGTVDASVPPGYGSGGALEGGPECKSDSMLIDDLETESYSAQRWYTVAGETTGNTNLDEPLIVDAPSGGSALHAKGTGYVSLDVVRQLDDVGVCYASAGGGFRFSAETDVARDLMVRVPLKSNTPVASGGDCAFMDAQCSQNAGDCCNDFHAATIRLSPGWRDYEIEFKDFFQTGFGKATDLDFSQAVRLEFAIQDASAFSVWLDDVRLIPTSGGSAGGEPCADNASGNVPFGSKPASYTSGALTPSGVSDQAVRQAYNQWSSNYLTQDCGGWIVDTSGDNGALTVSEAMGYGMILTAFMGDKSEFDGLWNVTRQNTSPVVDEFTSWRLGGNCGPSSESDRRSATDGDMDIAYGLLLADRQWGSGGSIDYRQEAFEIINALAQSILDSNQRFLRLGDWAGSSQGALATTMRSSDFMPDHFRAFAQVTSDSRWDQARTNIYATMMTVQSMTVGLVPDFIENADGNNPTLPSGEILESSADGTYGLNACRVPWRLGVDYLLNGDATAKSFLTTLTSWAAGTANNNPGSFVGKYWPDGEPDSADTQGALFYTAPLGVGAMAASNATWGDALWTYTRERPTTIYYQDTLRVLGMIAMSGNWWSPHRVTCE